MSRPTSSATWPLKRAETNPVPQATSRTRAVGLTSADAKMRSSKSVSVHQLLERS